MQVRHVDGLGLTALLHEDILHACDRSFGTTGILERRYDIRRIMLTRIFGEKTSMSSGKGTHRMESMDVVASTVKLDQFSRGTLTQVS